MMTFNAFVQYLIQIFDYSRQCSLLPIDLTHCFNFWVISYVIVMLFLLLVFVLAIRYVLRERAEFKAYQERKIQRAKIADPETMKKIQWQPDYDFGDIDANDLAEKMRQQLKNTKAP